MSAPMLQLEDLTKSFGSLVVTGKVNLSIAEQERHVVIGPNGAGKTSLLHQIGGQMAPSAGRILLRGQNIAGLAPDRICRLGVGRTFQKNNLFANLPVLENTQLAVQSVRANGWDLFPSRATSRAVHDRAMEVLTLVHLQHEPHRLVRTLSYGEQRQLEIGLALATDPSLLLLDEPTSGMSPAETARMIALIAGLPRSLTMVMIEHDMQVVFSIADRITVLHYGEVLATGRPDEITGNARVREVYLGGHH
jgi:branched-chain amino acid transport system ATP-binding protein